MNKKYIKPATEIITFETQPMMMEASFGDGQGSMGVFEDEALETMSKGHNFNVWGTDEDEE